MTFALGLQDLGGVRKGFWFIELQPEICWLCRVNSPTERKGKLKLREGKRLRHAQVSLDPRWSWDFDRSQAAEQRGLEPTLPCGQVGSQADRFSLLVSIGGFPLLPRDWGARVGPKGSSSQVE